MRYLLFLLLIIPFISQSQKVWVKGVVVSKENGERIPSVYIGRDSLQNKRDISNNQGSFGFKADLKKGNIYVFSHTAYNRLNYEIKSYHLKRIENDTLDLGEVVLYLRSNLFEPVEVSSKKVPEIIFQSLKFSVEDFELIDDRILMLVYEKTLKKSSELILTDKNQGIISSLFVPGRAKELIHDFRGEVYLKTEEEIYHVRINPNDRIMLTKLDRKKFKEQLEPVKDSLYEDIYYSDYSELFPKFSYFEYDREDSVVTKVHGIIDQVMMDMFRAEFKYVDVRTKIWAHNLQNETGIDKEDIVGLSVFTKSIYYEPLYAPMYLKEDTVYIFDYYKNFMYKYQSEKGITDSVGVFYHLRPKKTGWNKQMTQDLLNDEIYGVFNRFGYTYIKPINLETGNTDGVFKLYYRYVEKIIVKDNWVYFTYRPFESIQKKYIYREKIPNEVLTKKDPILLLTEGE